MSIARTATAPTAVMVATPFKASTAQVSVRQASFFGPRLMMQKPQAATLVRARQAVKVEARGGSKAGQQIQVR
jgi:hypothetical protein